MRFSAIAVIGLLSLGCAGRSATTTAPASVGVVIPTDSNSNAASVAPSSRVPPAWRDPIPTLTTAGAESCRILPPVALGTRSDGDTLVAFGPHGGVAALKGDPTTLVLQPIGGDASRLGEAVVADVGEGFEPQHVVWIDAGFVVLLRRWAWQERRVAWQAVLFAADGNASVAVDLVALDAMDVRSVLRLDAERMILVAEDAGFVQPPRPKSWHTLAVEEGSISSHPGAKSPTAPSAQDDALIAEIRNAASPPPRGPGGVIYEALGRPELVRLHHGHEIGHRLPLEWQGDPVGAIAMNVETRLFWSGSHFVYPFRGESGAMLLPIDCGGAH